MDDDTMDDDTDSLEDGIQLDFDLACLELTEARQAQVTDDTPAARRRVRECRARVDTILDMWNDVLSGCRRTAGTRGSPPRHLTAGRRP
jgi:hypothetical protein